MVKTAEGIEVYDGEAPEDYGQEIKRLVGEYEANLVKVNGEAGARALMTAAQSPTFKGMLKYIYINLFKLRPGDIKYNNKNCRVDYGDVELLNNIWDMYTALCYERLQKPTILNFCVMTGISRDTVEDWRNGVCRAKDGESGREHIRTAKNWYQECESGLVDSAMTGNPGGMFLLKASFGYSEQPQRIEIAAAGGPTVTMQELDELRKQHLIAPEKPEI